MLAGNPYVGPEVFRRKQRKIFFGRDQEAISLLSLVLSERLVLFHAPSGAGKSSLINARLVPCLTWRGVHVLPIGRIRAAQAPKGEAIDNIFVYNLLSSLHDSMATEAAPEGGTTISQYLHSYLQTLSTRERWRGSRAVLIIDQFEEIFTTEEENWPQREAFFDQLRLAMCQAPAGFDPMLWVVLAIREDYVARMAPFAYLLPGKLSTRFYMQPLREDAARQAIAEPAKLGGRAFEKPALDRLVTDLLRIRQGKEDKDGYPGEFVQPLQLQLVCSQLWDKLENEPLGPITLDHVATLANVDGALTDFYERTIEDVLTKECAAGTSESDLRTWFGKKLITDHTRNVVQCQEFETGGLPNSMVELLAHKRLIQPTSTAGGGRTYFELVHDRLIDPVLESNRNWRRRNPLIDLAEAWDRMGRPTDALLVGDELEKASQTDYRELGPAVAAFVAAGRQEKRRHDREKEEREDRLRREETSAKHFKRLSIALGLVCVVMLLLAAVAAYASWQEQLARSINLEHQAILESQRDPFKGVVYALAAYELENPPITHPGAVVASLVEGIEDLGSEDAVAPSMQIAGSEDALQRVFSLFEPGVAVRTVTNKAHGSPSPQDNPSATIIEFNPNRGGIFYTVGSDGHVREWQVNEGSIGEVTPGPTEVFSETRVITVTVEDSSIRAISADGAWMITKDGSGEVELHKIGHVDPADVPDLGSTTSNAFAIDKKGTTWFAWGGVSNLHLYSVDPLLAEPIVITPTAPIANLQLIGLDIDNRLLAVATEDQLVVLRLKASSANVIDGITGEVTATLSSPTALSLSHDGLRLAIGDKNGRVSVYHLGEQTASGLQPPWVEEIPEKPSISSLEFHPASSDWLAVGTSTGEVRVFHKEGSPEWKSRLTLKTQQQPVTSIRFSPDKRWLLSGGSDGSIYAWRIEIGPDGISHGLDPIVLAIRPDSASTVCFTQNSQLVATGPGEQYAWNMKDLAFLGLPNPEPPSSDITLCSNQGFGASDAVAKIAALSRDGKVAVVESQQVGQNCLSILYIDQEGLDTELQCLPYQGGRVIAVAYYSDEQQSKERIAVGDKDRKVWMWTKTGSVEGATPKWSNPEHQSLETTPQCLAFNPDGSHLAVAGGWSDFLGVFSTASGELSPVRGSARGSSSASYMGELRCQDMVFSPDGRYLSVAFLGQSENTNGVVSLWRHLDTNNPIRSALFEGGIDDLTFSPEGDPPLWLAGITQETGEVRLWRIRPEDLIEIGRSIVHNQLTRNECRKLLKTMHIRCKSCCSERFTIPDEALNAIEDALSALRRKRS